MGRGSPFFSKPNVSRRILHEPRDGKRGIDVIRKTVYLAAVLVLVVIGCAAHDESFAKEKQDGKTFWTHRYQYVRLVTQDHCPGQDTAANNHPQDLGGRLRTMLESLRVDLPEQEKTVPVFTRAELEQVTEPLEQAFRKAAPDEDVALVVEGMHPGEYGLQRCIVTARLFVQHGDQLNVIFGKLHVPVNDYDSPMGLEPTDYRLNPFFLGSRCENEAKKIPTIIASDTVRFYEKDGAPRKNWLTVSLAAQPQVPGNAVPMAMPAAPQPPTVTAPAAAPQPQTVNASPAAPQPRVAAPPPPVQDTTNRVVPAPVQQSQKSILERLQILKDLRVKGVITEQEYQDKKKEILDSL